LGEVTTDLDYFKDSPVPDREQVSLFLTPHLPLNALIQIVNHRSLERVYLVIHFCCGDLGLGEERKDLLLEFRGIPNLIESWHINTILYDLILWFFFIFWDVF